jgi:opacity protein-like surface antigen
VAYSFDSNWKLDLGYRYSDFGSVTGAAAVDGYSFTHQAKSRATSHEVMMGLRYGF